MTDDEGGIRPVSISPAVIERIVTPGVCAVVRDDRLRLVWCNDEYARAHGSSRDQLRGSLLTDIHPKAQAEERARLFEPALRGDRVVDYVQLWKGKRYLTRVWPLDPASFGTPGIFITMSPWFSGDTDARFNDIPIASAGELADLQTLSRRELQVLHPLAHGLSAREIAERQGRSVSTVERQIESIHAKLRLSNRAEVVRFVVERGLHGFTEEQWSRLISISDS
ncbi:MAG: PAS domain-containing protein [Phycisphaeraceae bacterium]|nr:PAS domain-containing protein [Phycisphaeraceae bacterium]MCW5754501.1 PAS domain-containing protein [Phycisphaeraceae bacterium]